MKKQTYSIIMAIVVIGFYIVNKYLDHSYYDDYEQSTQQEENKNNNDSFNYLPTSTTGAIVKHAYYNLSYVEKHEQAEWVAYELKKEHTKNNNFKRPYFNEDPLVKSNSASWKNYKNSGYDRGHLCPAADRRFNKKAHDETFLTSNVSPQIHKFNAGIWNDLEQKVRYWLNREKQFYIVTGPVFGSSKKAIGFERVTVPTHFYKVVLYYKQGKAKVIAFLMPHSTTSRNLKQFVLSVDELEKFTGIDFFPALPDAIESKIEAQKGFKGWKL